MEKDFPYIDADDVCFLQYTSGSTGWPKGVIVTHKNIMANEAMITEAFVHNLMISALHGCLFIMIWD